MGRSDIIIIIDEAQISYAYDDQAIWIECIKNQAHATFGPHFVLFSEFGSASNITLEILGSSPVTLESSQRVPLIVHPDSPHEISLYFTSEEIMELSRRLIGERNFSINQDALNHLFIQTSGHPGLTDGLLRILFDRPVSRSP
jgi:hypothetical protein